MTQQEADACNIKPEYCGFLCDEVTERQQAIVDEIDDLEKVNPEFGKEFRQRMVKLLTG